MNAVILSIMGLYDVQEDIVDFAVPIWSEKADILTVGTSFIILQ